MIFKQNKKDDVFFSLADKYLKPNPEVGKIYFCYDDGKISPSRLDTIQIIKEIDLDKDPIDKEMLEEISEAINSCYWLYEPEQTKVYLAQHLDNMLAKGERPCIFLRTKDGGWFSTGWFFGDSDLDVDGRLTRNLKKEFDEDYDSYKKEGWDSFEQWLCSSDLERDILKEYLNEK